MSYAGPLQQFAASLGGALPGFMRGPNSQAFLEALGLRLDVQLTTLIEGMRQSQPLRCWPDALAYIGADRGIRRMPSEPTESYRVRLARWRQIKRFAGSHYGEMINLQPYFLPLNVPKIRIVYQAGDGLSATWHTLDADGVYSVYRHTPSNWNWDGQQTDWSRFWVIVYVDGVGDDAARYDDGTIYDDGSTVWGGHLTAGQIEDIVEIVNESKAAYSVLAGVILATDPASFDPASTYTADANGATSLPIANWSYATDMATGHPTRLDGAIFAFDMNGH
jgi:hypothetical protein